MTKIYADYKLDSNDMFVITPEGTEFLFLAEDGFDDTHIPVTVVDNNSRKTYLVIF